MKRALVTGITGQDGSYLAELLLDKGYRVFGVKRRGSNETTGRIEHLFADHRLTLRYGDMTDAASLRRIVSEAMPDEVYNLAAQSHVKVSFEQAEYTANVNGLGTLRLLEAVREHCPDARFYQASSSEMFGRVVQSPQNEKTPFRPRSPYGTAKVFAFNSAVNHRVAYGMHVSNGIAFNHESPRRGTHFVTRKITRAVARIKLGLQETVGLGNLDALRDWGFAGDYVRAMWLILQQPEPTDYVIATGQMHSVRDFARIAFETAGLDPEKHITRDTRHVRPAEVDELKGDASKLERATGWAPTVQLETLVCGMLYSDLERETRLAGHKE